MIKDDGTDAFALLVLKPDAVYQRLGRGIRSFLDACGFQVAMEVPRYITPAMRFSLYRPDTMPWDTNWALGGVLYTLGPALVMLLRSHHVPLEYRSASDYLARGLKGHHDPLEAAHGTIRGRFNSVNRALNLVHASDDSAHLARELPILLDSWPRRDPVVAPARAGDEGPGAGSCLLDFGAAILRVHEWLLVCHRQDPRPRAAAAELIGTCRRRLAADDTRRGRQAILVSTLDELHELGRRCRNDAGSISRQLSDRAGLAALDYESVFDRLAQADLVLDRWTRYVLRTSLYYLPAPVPVGL